MKMKFTFLFLLLLSLACLRSEAQLAGGTYTINSALPTSGSNYASFTAAVSAMSSGVSGPVVFNVAAGSGPYTEQVTIGNITGTSATNTIQFNGNGATVQYTSTATYAGVFMLNGAKYVKIDSLTIKNLSTTYGYGVFLYNACTYDSLTRCTIDVSACTNNTSTNGYGIRISTTASGTSTTASGATYSYFGANKIVGSSTTNGAYYGIYCYGPNDNNIFHRNNILNTYYFGFSMNYCLGNKILYNSISRPTKVACYNYYYGIYNYYAGAGTQVIGNRIFQLDGTGYTWTTAYYYCIYNGYSTGTAAAPVLIANNAVYNTPVYMGLAHLATGTNDYTNIYHNTISADNVYNSFLNANYGLYCTSPTPTTNIRNNNISIKGGSGSSYNKYGLYISPSTTGALERNNIYVNTTGTLYNTYYNGAGYATLAAFNTAYPSLQAGAVSVDPQYTSIATGNLAPTNTVMFGNGVNLFAVVPTDITGQQRLASPAPGAFEFQANGTNNAGMVALTGPLGNYCQGPNPVNVSIYNAGTNSINTVTVNWSLNGVVQTPVTYSQTLASLTNTSGSPVGTLTLGNAALVAGVPVALKVWTSNPNGAPDLFNANDTLNATLTAISMDIAALRDTVCLNRGAAIFLTPSSGYNTGALQWQRSTNAGTSWDSIPNSDITNYATPNLTGNTWFRLQMKTGANTCYSDTEKIFITDPQLLFHTPDTSRCGPGTMTLNAAASVNAQVKWFSSATATDPVATGTQYVTPYLGSTTSFWVSAGVPSAQPAPANVVVSGTSTTAGASYMPFYYAFNSATVQYIVTAAEMQAQGYAAGNINGLGLQVVTAGSPNLGTVTIKIGGTNLNTLTGLVNTGLQTVYTVPSYTLQANATNYFDFQTPFYWDGVSNIIVGICRNGVTGPTLNTFAAKYNASEYKAAYYYAATDICSTPQTTSYSFYYRPNMLFKMTSGCEVARQKIDVVVHPVPVVDLGPDINVCVDTGAGIVLNAGLQPNNPQYLWDDSSVSQVRAVFNTGTYDVKVTNQYDCFNSDTIRVVLRHKPVVRLGNDTTVCNGVLLPLDAGNNGIEYFWNTGATSRVIDATSTGRYIAFVTNDDGCTTMDTINVTMQGELPSVQGIQITNNGQFSFHFTAVNPQNVIGYSWDFGDGSAPSYQAAPVHTYPDAGNYTVVLRLSSTCGFVSDTMSAHIVGIHQINVPKEALNVYPNPAIGNATVVADGTLVLQQLEVYNVLGQVVYKAAAQSKDRHVISLEGIAPGVYTIQVYTDKGTVSRKIEVLK